MNGSKIFLSAEKHSSRSYEKPNTLNIDPKVFTLDSMSTHLFDLSPDFIRDKLEPFFKTRNNNKQIYSSDVKSSKAYINAMRALQNKIKSLEKEREEALREQEEELGKKLAEQRERAGGLEHELKSREEVEKVLRGSLKQMGAEVEALKERLRESESFLAEGRGERDKLEKRLGEEIKSLLQEKTELRYKNKEAHFFKRV